MPLKSKTMKKLLYHICLIHDKKYYPSKGENRCNECDRELRQGIKPSYESSLQQEIRKIENKIRSKNHSISELESERNSLILILNKLEE